MVLKSSMITDGTDCLLPGGVLGGSWKCSLGRMKSFQFASSGDSDTVGVSCWLFSCGYVDRTPNSGVNYVTTEHK